MAELSEAWAAMSEEERDTYTGERKQQIAEDRETKAVGAHTVTVNSFHDVNNTVVDMENMVSNTRLSQTRCETYQIITPRT